MYATSRISGSRPHSIARPDDIKARFAFVGDSFVEFQPLSRTLPQAVEERFVAKGKTGIETINFGVSGTGIQSYFYRLRTVAMAWRNTAPMIARIRRAVSSRPRASTFFRIASTSAALIAAIGRLPISG